VSCYHPLRAYQNSNGNVSFDELRYRGDIVRSLELPCGRCVGCRLERSRQWAVRCVHESQLHLSNCMVLLTYDDEHLPASGSLRYSDFQLFMRKVRKLHTPGARFFMCGEYGELGRPHYHALLFGVDFEDKVAAGKAASGLPVWRSKALEVLWPHGLASLGSVTFQSAAYVARYILKKVSGDAAEVHYGGRVPEFCHMSLKPGIGARWLERYFSDVSKDGLVVMNGVEINMPRYYGKYQKRRSPEWYENLEFRREQRRLRTVADNTDSRLAVRELVANARVNLVKKRSH